MTDPWWPNGYDDPAFQVQRQVYSSVLGGDYVGGAAQFKGVLSGAGTALPAAPVAGQDPNPMWLVGTPVPTAIPTYQPPGTPPPPTRPAAVNDVLRYQNSAWVNLGPITQTVGTAVRYAGDVANLASAVGTRSILHVRPIDHDVVAIEWGWPQAPNDQWLELSIVRSAFGRPSTPNDGQTIYRQPRSVYLNDDDTLQLPPTIYDTALPSGRWYHYGLFFKVSPVEWVRGMVDSCLLAKDWQHSEHLWENTPPYYRWVDGQSGHQEGRLRQFMEVFGFELDTTREFVESWQHLYDIDWSPIRLLRKLGLNFGLEYESGLGDIRFRSMMANIGWLYKTRGTIPSLETLVANMSKYQCTVVAGSSLMLQPDDSDFSGGLGSWAGLHPDTKISGLTVLTPDKLNMATSPAGEVTPPIGRGAMKIFTAGADSTGNVLVTVGDGVHYPGGTEILPKNRGIPAQTGVSYGFSFSVMISSGTINVEACLLFFDATGMPPSMLSISRSDPTGFSDVNWHNYLVKGTAPAGTVFVVPGILFTTRPTSGANPSPNIYVAGAMVYVAGAVGQTLVLPPDRYLTMGDPAELLGPAKAGFDPFLLGAPRPRGT